MARFILDCELMKTRDSGLYYYCLNLGMAMNDILKARGEKTVKFYVPDQEAAAFEDPSNTIVEKRWHRFFKPFLFDCKVWHRPFQLGRIVPGNKKGIKLLITIHDLNVLHQDLPEKERQDSLENTGRLIAQSDAIVCVSEFAKADVMKQYDIGQKPIYVIHNGVNRFHHPALSTDSYRPGRPFLFTLGFVNRKKNHHSLLPLLEYNADLELLIAGRLDDPDYVESLKMQAEKTGTAHRLHILGPISDGEKAWYLQNCLSYMHPSFAEGFGLPVVEAMHFGRPVFLSSLTSLPEIGGDVGFYFKNFDPHHMQQVFEEGLQMYRKSDMEIRIRQRGLQFSWEKSAEEYIRVYQSIA